MEETKPPWSDIEARYLARGYTPLFDSHATATASSHVCMEDCVPLTAVALAHARTVLVFHVCPGDCGHWQLWDAIVPVIDDGGRPAIVGGSPLP